MGTQKYPWNVSTFRYKIKNSDFYSTNDETYKLVMIKNLNNIQHHTLINITKGDRNVYHKSLGLHIFLNKP